MSTIVKRIDTIQSDERDVPRNPMHCAIANEVRRQFPWARHITVGVRTIRMYDYRCEHNPEGHKGKCAECPSRCLTWATPLLTAQAIREFDRDGHATFPPFTLREDEARIIPATQDKVRHRQAAAARNVAIAAGEHRPVKRTDKALRRAMAVRRRS